MISKKSFLLLCLFLLSAIVTLSAVYSTLQRGFDFSTSRKRLWKKRLELSKPTAKLTNILKRKPRSIQGRAHSQKNQDGFVEKYFNKISSH